MARRATSRRSSDGSLPSRAGATVEPPGNATEGQDASGDGRGRTAQSGPSRQDRCTPTPRDPRPSRDDQGGKARLHVVVRARGRSRRSARTRRAGSGVRRTPEQPTSLASPIYPLGREQRVRDDLAPGTWTTSSSIPRMRPDPNRRTPTYRSATSEASGLRHACRRTATSTPEMWRRTMQRTVVGPCRPTTTQCRDFTLNRPADWMQLT